ncbi:MAG: hypothetical protein AAF602_12885, partial [Myxococcota bacterium]
WFKGKMRVPAEELRDIFERTAEHARKEYDAHRADAEAASAEVAELRLQHRDGKLTDDEFDRLLADLLGEPD